MKKLLKTGKKTLSVIMAVLMVMTAWVWVAPTEASAANGEYYYKIEITVTDGADGWGTNNVNFYHRANNGRASGTTAVKINMSNANWDEEKTHTFTGGPISGFPCGYTHEYSFGGGLTWRELKYSIKIFVGSSSSSYTQIYTNTFNDKSGAFSAAEGTFGSSTCVGADKYPYVATTKSISATTSVADIGIPPRGDEKDVKISERSIQYYTTDQYGVRYEPTSYTVSGVDGLTTPTSWSMGNSYKISASTSTTKSTTATYQTATAKLNWKNSNSNQTQHADSSYTFRVYNPRYKFTFDGNGGTLGTNFTYAYHGISLGDSTSTATSNNVEGLTTENVPTAGIKEGYTFKGIYTSKTGGSQITSSSTPNVTADTTYYAQWDANNYTATFYGTKANDTGSGTVEYVISTSTVPYNSNPVPPPTVADYSFGDYDYTFVEWDKAIEPIGVNGAEYRATYASTFVLADYDAVDDIVDEANDIINSANYKAIYSEESRHALETAVNSVIYNQGRTNQAVVDAYVPLIRDAIDGLGRQKYSVLFIDSVDNSVIEMRYPVYYGDPISMPDDPKRGFTTTDHYVFTGWEPSETGDDITFVSKNMVILAKFDKNAHTYTDTELPSNCTTQAGVLHKCYCGYEYVEYSGSVGTEHNLETEFTIDIEPTCTTVGSKSRHCTRCSYRADVTEIPALNHDFTDGYQGVVINPGCENDGAEVSECQRCGYDKYSIVPASGHSWTEKVINPTCTSSGYTVKACSSCNDEDIITFTDPIDHTYTEATDEYIAPTCTGLGKKVYYCSCGAQKVETIPSDGHDWESELTVDFEATCTTKGQQSIHCSVCDVINTESIIEIDAKNHIWGEEVCEQKESCGIKGLYVKTCEVCYENSSRITEALVHNYKNIVTEDANCTEAGKKITSCEICGDIKTVEIIQPTGHTYENEGAVVETPATCTSGAYTTYNCDNCDYSYVVLAENSVALPHDFTGAESNEKAATCEENGSKTVQCKNCSHTIDVVIPKLGHAYGDWKVVKAATNTEDGEWTSTCTKCGDVKTLTIPAGGHTWDDGTVKKAATCTTEGTMVYACNNPAHTNCDITLEVTIPATQHTVAQKESKKATCTTKGEVESYCSICGESFSKYETPVVPHTYAAGQTFAPTCTTSGYTVMVCSCGASYNMYDASKPATGHSYTGSETTAPGCTTEGVKTYTCACGEGSFTDVIPAKGHNFVENTEKATAATCTALATKTFECSCGASYVKHEGALAEHNFDELVKTVPATNDSLGYEERKCDCGLTKITILEATGTHVFTEKIEGECVAPTCTENGTDVYKCTAHEACTAKSSVLVPRLGHTAKAEYTAPTCIAEGSSKAVCETCGDILATEIIPAIPYHNFSGEGEVTLGATCTDEGTMTYTCQTDGCNATKTETIPAKGHKLSVDITEADCETKGKVVISCDNCNDVTIEKTVEFPALGHSWNDGELVDGKDATCTQSAQKLYTCTACNKTKTETIPAKGHSFGAWEQVSGSVNTDGYWKRTCACGETETLTIPRGHNLVKDTVNSKLATCTAEGKEVYICNAHTNCDVKIEVTLPMLQHNYTTEYVDSTCDRSGYIKTSCTVCNKFIVDKIISPKAHKFDGGTKYPATCTDAAYHLYQCINTDAQGNDNCNYSYKAFAGGTDAALGHNLVAGETTATCEGKGSQTFYCNRENCGYATTVEMPARGHDYVLDATTSATCAAPATKTYKCSRCADSYIEYADDKLTEHNAWSVWTVVEATNTSLGYKTRTCNTCGQKEFEIIPATGEHVFDFLVSETKAKCEADGEQIYSCSAHPGETGCKLTSKVTIPATGHSETFAYEAATCSKDGLAKMYCSTCTTVLSEQKIDKLGCNWVQGEVTPSTCNTKGSIAYSCTRCTNTMSAELPTNANAHQYETKVTPATCYSEGSAETKCKLCTNELSVVTLAKLEHTWNDGKATTSATCIAPGVMTYKCTVDGCNAEKTEPIDALGHNWGNWFVEKASTNTAEGTMKRECTVDGCDAYETHTIPAGGHEWDEGKVTKEATCTSTGTKVYACKNHTGDNACGITFTVTLDKLQHKLTTSTTPATCTTDGEVVTKCEKCNTTTITTIIPATGHTYNDGVKTPATCTKTGEILYTCTAKDCGETKKVTLEKLQHVFEAIEEVDATCVKSGYKVYKCKTCTETYNVINGNAKGHNYTVKVSSDASCLEGGKMVLKCADCDATMETSVPALGHDYKLISSTSATCAAAATETYKCSRCEASYTVSTGNKTENHNWTAWNVVVEATYTTLGCESRSCPDCGKVEIKTIEAIGDHTFVDGEIAETKAATCTENGYIIRKCTKHSDCGLTSTEILPATGHNEQTIAAVPATCTTAGSSEGSECTKCGTVLVAPVTLPELGHAWGNEVVTPATCQSEGKIAYTCTRGGCLAAHEVTIPVDGTAHKLETTVNAATCTENGSVTEKCTVDGCSYSKEVVLTAKGHIWNETASSTTPATCENAGSATYKCKYCTAENIVTIPAIGHIYKAGEKVDATCTTSGYTVYTCEHDAKHTYKVYDADATAKPHTWKQTNMEYATCTTNGSVTYKCENCEATKTEIVPAIGHKFNVTEAPATCTQAGTRTYLCTCGATYTELVEPVKGHSFGEWTVVTEVTNGTDGQWKRVCANDNNHVEYITIPAGGHNFDTTTADVYDAPSCTEEGSATYYCKAEGHENCGVTVTVTVPATGHNGKIVYNAPSCETPGSSEIYCNTCNKTIAKEEIPALGYHDFSADGVVNEGDEPTCTEKGTITFTCCKDGCGAVKKVKIPAKGHSLNTTVTEATCEAEGSVVTKCTVDGCTYVHESKTLAVKPHSISISNAYPGCEKDGYVKEECNKCDYEKIISTTPALGHSFAGEETVVTPATCLTKGEKTVKCSYCSKTETVEIPALGHNYEAGEEVEATCTASGYIPYTCQNKDCTSSYKELTSNPKGHNWNETASSTTPATCEIDGKATYKCENCEATNVVVTPKFGHSWTNWTVSKEPTATEDGLKTRTCLRGCTESVTIPTLGESAIHKVDFVVNGEIIFSQTVNHLGAATAPAIENKAPDAKYHYSALWDTDFSVVTSDLTVTAVFTPVSHSFGDWVVDTEADCKNAGLRHRVCDCGYVQQEVIERKEHTYIVESEKAPTCTEIGARTLVCSNCGDKTTENIKKLGHEMTYYEGYKATCDTDGLARHYSCSRCGKKFEDRAGKTELSTVVIVKKYHTYVVVEGVAPTCTAEGVTDYRYCTTCGYTQHPEAIAATGHADANNDNTCDKCGATYMNGDTIICSCYCHKNGFFNELIYKILSFFWRLFGSNKSCECGKVHY